MGKIPLELPGKFKGLLYTETGSLREFENATVSGARRFGLEELRMPRNIKQKSAVWTAEQP